MIYFFYGSDVEKTRTKAFEWIEKARAKEPHLAYARLAREELTSAALDDAALAGGLFVRRMLVLLDDPFAITKKSEDDEEDSGASSLVEEKLEVLAASDNAIVILAPKLAAAKAKKIAALAKIEYKFDRPAARADARGFNSGLVNAFAAKQPEKLWIEIIRSLRAGDAPEQLHGLLHWKARDLMEKASASGRSGWKPEESRALSLDLIKLLQDSRRSGLDLSESLERLALSI